MDDLVVRVLSRLVDGGVRSGELGRDGRALRWAEAGSGVPAVVLDAALGEPGSLAFAGVMPLVAPRARVLAYDRAGIGASDPVSPLTLAIQVADLAALAREAGGGCVLAGHSWGAMLAQLVTLSHPELAAGLVLIDPAEEDLLASLPPEDREQEINSGQEVLDEYASGALPASIRELFGPFARGLTDDERLRALILDAYVSCYAEQSQVQVVADEKRRSTGPVSSGSCGPACTPSWPPPCPGESTSSCPAPATPSTRSAPPRSPPPSTAPSTRSAAVPSIGAQPRRQRRR
jgi:pimeloyl-ACP methyl ester carboxylesterase